MDLLLIRFDGSERPGEEKETFRAGGEGMSHQGSGGMEELSSCRPIVSRCMAHRASPHPPETSLKGGREKPTTQADVSIHRLTIVHFHQNGSKPFVK